jgi:hypothetical protein
LKQGYREDEGLLLESDADEQLLLNIPFNQAVRLHAIVIKGPADGSGPRTVKLFANRPSMGFSDVSTVQPAQELQLSAAQLAAGEPLPLRMVKFNAVNLLTVFIESNQGGEETTRVSKLVLVGTTDESMKFNVADIKKVDEKTAAK